MCPLRRLGRHAVRCATVRNSSFRCCRRAKAASRSRTARSFWKKMATSILACRTHCCTSTPSCKPFPTSPTRCTPWLAEWKSCACTLASFWNRTSAISSSDRNSLLHLYAELQAIPNKPDEVHALARRVEELRVHLGFILESNQRNIVFRSELTAAPLRRAASHCQQARRGARPGSPSGRVARAPWLHSGIEPAQYRLLDRTPHRTRPPAQCISPSHPDHGVRHPAYHLV